MAQYCFHEILSISMGRPPRLAFSGLVYHVVDRGNNRQRVFSDRADFAKYLGLLKRYKKQYDFRLYHYVLMNNHVHLLLETSDKGTISKIMQSITLAYTRYYNGKYESFGHVWQGRFKSPVIEKDSYLLQCARYIELNPVRAELVQDPGEYEWSSHRFYAFGELDELLDKDPLYEELSRTTKDPRQWYREFIREGIPKEIIKEIRYSIARDHILGRGSFIELIEERFRSQRRNRRTGRPRKVLP